MLKVSKFLKSNLITLHTLLYKFILIQFQYFFFNYLIIIIKKKKLFVYYRNLFIELKFKIND